MKLDRGNPNLMKRPKWLDRECATVEELAPPENVALPRTFSHLLDGQYYVPDRTEPTRPGATDALRLPSRGYPT